MNVTTFSKSFGEPSWAQWESEFSDETICFREGGKFFGDSLRSGERFHQHFSRFTKGLWVPSVHYTACLAIEATLVERRVAEIESEVPVQGFGLRGQVDVVGKLDNGRPVVVELKTTLGEYALKPRPAEVIQLGTYASLLRLEDPLLLWLRISLKSRCISVFSMDESTALMSCVRGHPPKTCGLRKSKGII